MSWYMEFMFGSSQYRREIWEEIQKNDYQKITNLNQNLENKLQELNFDIVETTKSKYFVICHLEDKSLIGFASSLEEATKAIETLHEEYTSNKQKIISKYNLNEKDTLTYKYFGFTGVNNPGLKARACKENPNQN